MLLPFSPNSSWFPFLTALAIGLSMCLKDKYDTVHIPQIQKCWKVLIPLFITSVTTYILRKNHLVETSGIKNEVAKATVAKNL